MLPELMEDLEKIRKELKSIATNFAKSINRPYTENTLKEKEEITIDLLDKAKAIAQVQGPIETVNKIKEIYVQISTLADQIQTLISKQRNRNMAFDIKTATSLLPQYSGNENETEPFIASMELLDELTPTDQKQIMIKFIKTRLTGKARTAISEETNTVASIKAKLVQKFTARTSSDAILSQLRECRQGSRRLTDFSNQIEELSGQLTRAFISEGVATGAAAEKLAEKFSAQALINNVANNETAIILKASNLSTLSELTAKAIAVDKPQNTNVLHYRSRTNRRANYNRRNQFENNHNRFSNRDRQNRSSEYYHTQRVANNGQSQPRNESANNSRRPNKNRNHRQGYRRVNYTESGEYQPPQPEDTANRLGEDTPEYQQ